MTDETGHSATNETTHRQPVDDVEPCPPWCAYGHLPPGGREFEHDQELGLAVRPHETYHGDPSERFHAYAFAHEAKADDGSVHPVGAVRVAAGVDDEYDGLLDAGLSPTEVRAFALRLLEVADEAEQIDAARRGA